MRIRLHCILEKREVALRNWHRGHPGGGVDGKYLEEGLKGSPWGVPYLDLGVDCVGVFTLWKIH